LNSLHNNNFTGALSRKEQLNEVVVEEEENSLIKNLVVGQRVVYPLTTGRKA
jgi:hypothetical protein